MEKQKGEAIYYQMFGEWLISRLEISYATHLWDSPGKTMTSAAKYCAFPSSNGRTEKAGRQELLRL
jgi:hypothetical protein